MITAFKDVTRHSLIEMHLRQAIRCHIHKISAICTYHSANLKARK